ncbi:MAG: DUF58 domain-containing protein [Anaerobutyricum sp.]|nr:DUF58 domain-containing protein [Anaerobutyricum sp.]
MRKRNIWLYRTGAILLLVLWSIFLMFAQEKVRIICFFAAGVLFLSAFLYDACLPSSLKVSLSIPSEGAKKERIFGEVNLVYHGKLPLISGLLAVTAEKKLTGETEDFSLKFLLISGKEIALPIEVSSPFMGTIRIKICSAFLYGLFGWKEKTIPLSLEKEVMIRPDFYELNFPVENEGIPRELYDNVQDVKKTDGPGDFREIRPYRQGDPVKNIHWKLTGKTDEIMIKEMEVPVTKIPAVFLETRVKKRDAPVIDILLETALSVCAHMTGEGQIHCLMWWSREKKQWEFSLNQTLSDFESVLGKILEEEFFEEGPSAMSRIDFIQKEQFSEIIYVTDRREEGDLSYMDPPVTLLVPGEKKERVGEEIDRILTGYRGGRNEEKQFI